MEFRIQSALEASGYGEESQQTASSPAGSGGEPGSPSPESSDSGEVRMIGRYQFLSRLGRGGMGEVLKAKLPQTGQLVAIKLLDAEGYEDEELLRRFEREAEAVREIEHPNIARFFGLERDEQGLPFIVMEFIQGDPLDRFFKNHPNLALSRIIYFIAQAARGLEFARRRALIHRDIKPANLMIMADDKLKIIDFGLAKSLWDRSVLTNTGTILGTPRYISPEQAMGRSTDHRSDLYSLGATFYELATGQAPFDGDSPMSIMMKHVNTPLMPPKSVKPELPVEVNDVIMRMMAKNPQDRYQEYESLIRDLEMARIQQMSKEKRLAEEAATVVQEPQETVLLDEELDLEGMRPPGSDSGRATRSRPSPYLTEGLVQVEYKEEEPPPPKSRLVLYTVVGLVIMAGGAFLLLSTPKTERERKEPTGLAAIVRSLSGKSDQEPTPAELAREDARKVRMTAERMDAARLSILRHMESLPPGEQPMIRDMRQAGAITEEESQDAWGNDFYVARGKGGAMYLNTAGRDSIDGSQDDFKFSLDGVDRTAPNPLSEEHFLGKNL